MAPWRNGSCTRHRSRCMDYVGPALGALVFVAVMSLVAEPTRRTLNDAHPGGRERCVLEWRLRPVGIDLPRHRHRDLVSRTTVVSVCRVGWLVHAGWDLAHHLWGNPIWPFMPSSAFGCMIFDSVIAVWFLAGCAVISQAPSQHDADGRRVNNGPVGIRSIDCERSSRFGGRRRIPRFDHEAYRLLQTRKLKGERHVRDQR